MKGLSRKHEELDLIPRSYIKLGTTKCASNHGVGGMETGGS